MKAVLIIVLSVLFLSLNACKKIELNEDVPNCVRKEIRKILNEPVQNPGAKVWKWEDDANTYYYITSGCCDQFNYLYDDKCNVVCAPDGGFTGTGDGNCPVFQGNIQQTLVWEDTRE